MRFSNLFSRTVVGIDWASLTVFGVDKSISDLDLAGVLIEETLNPAFLEINSSSVKIANNANIINGTLGMPNMMIDRYLYDNIVDLGVIEMNPTPNGFVFKEHLRNIKYILDRMILNKGTMNAEIPIAKIMEHQGVSRLTQLGDAGSGGKWKKVNDDYIDDVRKSGNLSSWEYLHHGFAMLVVEGTSNGKTVMHRKLVTKSPEIIRKLNEMGLLLPKKAGEIVDVNDIISKVNPASDKANLLEGKTAMFCLDWQPSLHKYNYTVKSKCELKDAYMLPLLNAEAAWLYMFSTFACKSGFAEVRYKDIDGENQIVKVASSNKAMTFWYKDITEAETKDVLVNKVNNSIIGFDPNNLVYRMFNIESSVHGRITTSLRPGEIVQVIEGAPQAVNIAAHDLDYNLISLIFHSRVNRMTANDFNLISKVIPINAPTVRAKKQAILQWQSTLRPDKLYDYLTYPDAGIQAVFGNNIKAAMSRRKSVMPRYLKVFNPVDIKAIEAEAAKRDVPVELVLHELMLKGVLHATVYSSTGSVRETYLTCNPKILEAVYGDNYVSLYGSRRVRLVTVKEIFESKNLSVDEALNVLTEYGLDDYTAWHVYDTYQKSFNNMRVLLQSGCKNFVPIIVSEIAKLAESDIGAIKMVTGYKVNAYSLVRSNGEVSLYDCFNISNIISLECSENVTLNELADSAKVLRSL